MQRIFPKADFKKLIEEKHAGRYKETDFFKPISIAIQGNNYCSFGKCAACGISSTFKKSESLQLPKEVILDLLKQAQENGIFLFYTNFTGEITDDLDFFGEMLKKNPKMDAHKINTNCEKFTSIEKSVEIMRKLKELGWTNTNYITPILVLSIGTQQPQIPLTNIINGLKAFKQVFSENEAYIMISHYFTTKLYQNTLEEFKELYKKEFGCELDEKILKSDPITRFGRAKNFPKDHFEEKLLSEFVSNIDCFKYWYEKYVCPDIYVHRDYSIFTCPLFEPHKALQIGNAKNDSLKKAIENANNNKFLRAISEKGTIGIYEMLKDKHPELKEIKVTNRHEACKILSEYFKEN
jgi:hypothetical protein